MAKKGKAGENNLVISSQNRHWCKKICFCWMLLVFSVIALIFLTVFIFIPSIRIFQSDFKEIPGMCTTMGMQSIDTNDHDCEWTSCEQWSLSRSSKNCKQITATLRHNGSDLLFKNCIYTTRKSCYTIGSTYEKKYSCLNNECDNLNGIFNCTNGYCSNITDSFRCDFTNTDIPISCAGTQGNEICKNITGLYDCNGRYCRQIRPPFNCEKKCNLLPMKSRNIILFTANTVIMSQCQSVIDEKLGTEVWNENEDNILMATCFDEEFIKNELMDIKTIDCINGVVLRKNIIRLTEPISLQHIRYLYENISKPAITIAPSEKDLLISERSKLMVNLKGYVRTFHDTCEEFFHEYGKDGSDFNDRIKYPCYYAENNSDIVVVQYEYASIYRDFIISLTIPIILIIISILSLIWYQRYLMNKRKLRLQDDNQTEAMLAPVVRHLDEDNDDADMTTF